MKLQTNHSVILKFKKFTRNGVEFGFWDARLKKNFI